VDTSFTAFRSGTYLQAGYRLSERLQATGGLRLDYYDFAGQALRLAPRFGLRYDLGASSSIFTAGGRYYQPPSYIWLIGDPRNPETLEPIRADQVVLGFEVRPRRDLKLQLEAFYKWYGDYPARVFRPQAVLAPSGFEDATDDIPFGLEPLTSEATGRVYGGEAFVQKKLSAVPVYGLLSLSFARAEFTSLEGRARPGRYDARFIGTALAGYRFNPKWEVSGKLRVATGLPTTPFIETGPDTGQRDYGRYNEGDRFPTFHALDIRVDRRFSFRGWQLELYVDVQNVYGRENVSGVRWDFRTDEPEFDEALGVLPTLGVNVEF
jgi:outer membrane receptor protein involved in Fe transport